MVYTATKIISFLLTPGSLLLLALLVGCGMIWTKRRLRTGRVILSAVCLLLLLTTALPLDEMVLAPLENRFPVNPALPAKVDGIIVLGGSIDPYLSLTHHQVALNDSAERLMEAARLARQFPEAKLLFTGGSADPLRPEMREAPLAVQAFAEMGIDPARLVIEDASRNTYENAVFSHMPRSVGVFRQVGWPVLPWPVNFISGGSARWVNTDKLLSSMGRVTTGLHEWVGLLFYRLSGWTDSLFPEP